MQFADKTIEYIETSPEFGSGWEAIGPTRVFLSRAAIGIVLCLGPYNYPLNETYAT
jgi:glyceraldehyde-3-phosphate dehydrogenase (NADP+)